MALENVSFLFQWSRDMSPKSTVQNIGTHCIDTGGRKDIGMVFMSVFVTAAASQTTPYFPFSAIHLTTIWTIGCDLSHDLSECCHHCAPPMVTQTSAVELQVSLYTSHCCSGSQQNWTKRFFWMWLELCLWRLENGRPYRLSCLRVASLFLTLPFCLSLYPPVFLLISVFLSLPLPMSA